MKKWYKSKTVWVNVGLAVVSVMTALQNTELVADYPGLVAGLGAAVGVVNVVLRTITKEAITK